MFVLAEDQDLFNSILQAYAELNYRKSFISGIQNIFADIENTPSDKITNEMVDYIKTTISIEIQRWTDVKRYTDKAHDMCIKRLNLMGVSVEFMSGLKITQTGGVGE